MIREFFRALTEVMRALVPFLQELSAERKARRIKAEYAAAVAGAVDDPGRAFAHLDEQLHSEGVAHEDGGDRPV